MNGWKDTRRVALSRAQSPAVLVFVKFTAGDHRRSFIKLIMHTAAAVRASIAHAISGKVRQFVFVFSTVKLYTKNPHLFVALVFVLVDCVL